MDVEGKPSVEKAMAIAEVMNSTKNPVIELDSEGKHAGFRPVSGLEREVREVFQNLKV